jgi:hypothetical protein
MPEPAEARVPGGGDRRVAVRVPSTQDAPCHFATLERIAFLWGRVRDVSRGGISLYLSREFPVGQQLIIELPSKSLADEGSVPVHVVHANALDDGGWLIGCAFDRLLQEKELEALR